MSATAPASFTGETANPPPQSPNPFRDPRPWWTVILGGRTIKAPLTQFNGLKIEDIWKADKSKNTSGHTPKFGGTKGIEDIMLTFRACDADDFDDIDELFTLMAPVAGSQFAGTPASYPVPGQTTGVGSPQAQLVALANVSIDPNTGKIQPAGDNAFGAASSSSSSEPNPGPRPPTLPITNAACAWHGVFAVARKSIELVWLPDDNSWVLHLGLIQDEPPTPIAAGAMTGPAPTPAASGGSTGFAGASASADGSGAAGAAT